jgi:hypothetical protein
MVRGLLEQLEPHCRLNVICKQRNAAMSAWMYRDEPRIQLACIDEDHNERAEVRRACRRLGNNNLLIVGHRALRWFEAEHSQAFFDELFYMHVGLPYAWRFEKCFWQRDVAEEERVFRKLAPDGPYAFVHDDAARGFVVNTSPIAFPIVRNDISESIFHLGMLLERAAEVHCMESSIRCMIESLNMERPKLFYHNFRYPNRPLGKSTQLSWREIQYTRQ